MSQSIQSYGLIVLSTVVALGNAPRASAQELRELFAGIVEDAMSRQGIEPVESYFCQSGREVTPRDPDPDYTIRAWRAVVTYLLRQHEFLYE